MNTLVFDSVDLALTEEFLSTHYAPMRIVSSTSHSPAHIARAVSSSVIVDHLDLGFEMTYDVQPLGRIGICDIESGAIEDHVVDGWTAGESFGPGEVFSFAPPERGYSGRLDWTRYRVTMLDPTLLDQVASSADGETPVRLLDHRPVSPAAGQRLRRVIDHLHRDVFADDDASANALVVGTASRYLAASVLAAFPHSALPEPTTADRAEARPAAVRRAVDYIEAHAGMNISSADIAAATHLTVRGLQYAFRRHLGTTPMAYVRRVRLAAAHRDLQAADPTSGDTVTAIATRWGFLHQGRFGAAYRHAYGRTPGQTLRGRAL